MIKVLMILTTLFGIGAAVLGFMTQGKVNTLKTDLADTKTTLAGTRDTLDKTTKNLTDTKDKLASTQTELESKKAEAVKLSADLNAANSKVQDLTTQYNEAQKKADDLTADLKRLQDEIDKIPKTAGGEGNMGIAEQISELKKQIEAAEAEKSLLLTQLTQAKDDKKQLEVAEQKRKDKVMSKGLTGRVLAVNPAWNFIVLNLGDRQGVVEGGEMVVRRGDVMVGKVKITSVEPSTSIGDIVLSSVPRGMQVQPGDTVVYPGS